MIVKKITQQIKWSKNTENFTKEKIWLKDKGKHFLSFVLKEYNLKQNATFYHQYTKTFSSA